MRCICRSSTRPPRFALFCAAAIAKAVSCEEFEELHHTHKNIVSVDAEVKASVAGAQDMGRGGGRRGSLEGDGDPVGAAEASG
jgi:hypothetical protein